MTDSPLAALLDAYDKVVLRWERAGYLAAVEPEAIAARAAILAEFATLEAERDEIRKIHHEEMDLHDEMEKRLHDKYEAVVMERDDLKARLADLHRPTHGPCCTCQACGKPYDECRCDIDDLADELAALRVRVTKVKEADHD